jgi:hypothetical protein
VWCRLRGSAERQPRADDRRCRPRPSASGQRAMERRVRHRPRDGPSAVRSSPRAQLFLGGVAAAGRGSHPGVAVGTPALTGSGVSSACVISTAGFDASSGVRRPSDRQPRP